MSDIANLYWDVAELYELDPRDMGDVAFFLDFALKTPGKNILELASGTGRVTIPLARNGCSVTAIDFSDPMLELLNQKLEREPELKEKITAVKGDMSDFHLDKTFDMIFIPFRSFQLLLTKDKALSCLRCVKEHMTNGSIFIVDLFEPPEGLDESWGYAPTLVWKNDISPDTNVRRVDEGYKIDLKEQILFVTQRYFIEQNGKVIEEKIDHLNMKYYYYEQMVSLIKESGLSIIDFYGWFDKSRGLQGRDMIFVCAK